MKITKFGHCCLLIEEQSLRILTDPGTYSSAQNDVRNLDVVLITHDHPDHLHVESLKAVVANNPGVRIFTNTSVAKLLEKEGIKYELLEHGQSVAVNGVLIEGLGEHHAEMWKAIPRTPNTGYFVANYLFYPGDAFTVPEKPVPVLALPTAGPWMKLLEGIEYAIAVKPKKCFPVHDGILKNIGSTDRIPAQVLPPLGIEFTSLELGKEYEF
ncbi:MAG: MBL fold metallo-hydrolase [bacterium]|nr:MBL fold metallo-hydrolase [bacterium]